MLHFRPEAIPAQKAPAAAAPQRPPVLFPGALAAAAASSAAAQSAAVVQGEGAGPAGRAAAGVVSTSDYPAEAFLFGNMLEVAAAGLRGSAQLGAG